MHLLFLLELKLRVPLAISLNVYSTRIPIHGMSKCQYYPDGVAAPQQQTHYG